MPLGRQSQVYENEVAKYHYLPLSLWKLNASFFPKMNKPKDGVMSASALNTVVSLGLEASMEKFAMPLVGSSESATSAHARA